MVILLGAMCFIDYKCVKSIIKSTGDNNEEYSEYKKTIKNINDSIISWQYI